MSAEKKYYVQVLERAAGLLRQGHPDSALTVLQAALDQKKMPTVDDWDGDTDIELVFEPRMGESPRCWIQDKHLYIDDKNWDIDQQFREFLFQTIKHNVAQGEAVDIIRTEATNLLKKGVRTGRVRKKSSS